MELILNLIAGALGGNVAGSILKKYDLGTLGNSLAGILGGGLGGQLLSMIGVGGAAAGGSMVMDIIGSLATGGVGGAVVMVIIGVIKKALVK
ncbi:hypothetical protein ROA7450_03900 [Roseovarius albus]|uniref:DNA methyltransferase n=1 Tax=Roseovarius albus TaxID=1247867 RepID=A0A1X7A5C1_9RHOB|nr:hypothetical protein [Roseovarius albus]SLN71048.1 hypothetical protein ROA7450_03900 [Roseovarius albus]